MASNARQGSGVLGTLRSADGKGVVRIENRYDADPGRLWSALTDPAHLARWYGQVEGDLRPGGQFRLHADDADSDATGRIDVCEPQHRLQVTTRETDESYQRGQGAPPYDGELAATLTPAGDQTILVFEVTGMPLDAVAFFGAGWQIHAENLAAYLSGRGPGDTEARWNELVPAYQDQAARLG